MQQQQPAAGQGLEYTHEDHYQQYQESVAQTQEAMRATYISEQGGPAAASEGVAPPQQPVSVCLHCWPQAG